MKVKYYLTKKAYFLQILRHPNHCVAMTTITALENSGRNYDKKTIRLGSYGGRYIMYCPTKIVR